ncbi:MAG TPA: non-canonical purine NTP pyrophosphatase [Candidatus Thermoplasmatota archaeon]|nr:non-canonical purine NTP pyrophosphatase [Candidatus Thermoplasmatota archaeon]
MTPRRAPRQPATAGDAAGAAAAVRTLRFVTGNAGKVRELAAMAAPHGWQVLQDARGYPEVQAGSLEEVCAAGARHLLAEGLQPPFCLEDSGLFVPALRGFPGVYSRHALDTVGIDGLLRLLRDEPAGRRRATFRTCLTLVEPARARQAGPPPGRSPQVVEAVPSGRSGLRGEAVPAPAVRVRHFRGACHGRIVPEPRGEAGFGFDPVFAPSRDAGGRTFAEMPAADKNAVSHRGQAVRRLLEHLAKAANP